MIGGLMFHSRNGIRRKILKSIKKLKLKCLQLFIENRNAIILLASWSSVRLTEYILMIHFLLMLMFRNYQIKSFFHIIISAL